ncbi:M56 family metallopeptidase [Hoyosella rhizosphaerae]|uniref:Integral membrane protein n=1 Tax=Hoyosella rhizosphaerae TaxID=1755582 RepID=A0A916X8P4_9ACTN|nr:M56 family metallopeptidase [Hoyosella rhizosphaerae]MBN4927284.1 M56 family metallopeptidase [Hoyosella rhizosphaerae]GGC52482.1 integral membrane protein [Hoyosella rhizosphaerae]
MTGTTAAAFAVLAVALAGPIPAILSKAQWPLKAPRAALVLWQSIAIAAVLSAFSSGLAIASMLLVPGPDGLPTTSPTEEIAVLGLPLWILSVGVFAITVLIGARLIYSTAQVSIRTRKRRAHHRMLVDLLDQPDPRLDHLTRADLRVLRHSEPLAYCLPGLRQRVVVSEGALDKLAPDELDAILAHERAHLRARHDLVLEAFTAVHAAFPRVVRSKSALGAVRLLIELLADDAALRATGATPLARALVTCSSNATPDGAMAAGGIATLLRIQRLADGTYDLRTSVAAYTVAALILIGPTIAVAVPWLVELSRLFGLTAR